MKKEKSNLIYVNFAFEQIHFAGNNEIDKTLLELLEQNISAARAAGQNDPAVFMEKIRDAAKKFVLSPSSKS